MVNRNFSEIEDTEKSFLGCLMHNSKAIYSVVDQISVSDFFNHKHSKIYSVMLEFASQGIECDVFKLQSYFQARNEAYVCEGQYLFAIAENSSGIGFDYYVKQIKQHSKLRKMHVFLSTSLNAINEEMEDIEILLEKIDQNYNSLGSQINEKSYVHLSELIDEKIKKLNNGKASNGLSTGFANLDYYITGMKPGQMITLAAPTSQGKTAFALNVAANVALQGKSVLFFSLEMEAEDLLDRIICANARINSKALDDIQFAADEVNAISKSFTELRGQNIWIDDSGSLDIARVKARCQQKKMEKGGLDLVVLDYLQLVKTGDIENRTIAITNISNKIKQTARELKIPILCLAQLNRDVYKDKQEPELHHLKDSGSIEQDSDIVFFLWRDKKSEYGKTICKVGKNRKGRCGKFDLEFIGENYLFQDWTVAKQPDAQGFLPVV